MNQPNPSSLQKSTPKVALLKICVDGWILYHIKVVITRTLKLEIQWDNTERNRASVSYLDLECPEVFANLGRTGAR